MQWMETLRHLIHTIGWNGTSRMTDITWKYAIIQALKLAKIHYLPGDYNQRMSYVHLNILTYQETFPNSQHQRDSRPVRNPATKCKLARDILGFELPLNKFNIQPLTPPLVENIFQQFLSRTKPKHGSQSAETEKKLQTLAKNVLDKLDMSESWDAVIIITALTLSRRKPLPMQEDDLRDCQWVDLVTRRKSSTGGTQSNLYGNPSEFCLSFIVTAMLKRYTQFHSEPYAGLMSLWDKRWGGPKINTR